MCNVCYGLGNCPVCSDGEPDNFDELLDIELNLADDANKTELENGEDDN